MSLYEIKRILKHLQNNEITVFDVPKEYAKNAQIAIFERKAGWRITGTRGFDVISNSFFVNETLIHIGLDGKERKEDISLLFEDFDSYFYFLDGDIYNMACYTFCHLPENTVSSKKINLERFFERKSFLKKTIDDFSLSTSDDEMFAYREAEQIHNQCKQWVIKFNDCTCFDEFVNIVDCYNGSNLATIIDNVEFFLFQYIFADIDDKKRFSVIMEYVSTSTSLLLYNMKYALCSIYNPDDVLQALNCSKHGGEEKELESYIRCLKSGEIEFDSKAYFDKKTHYYCEETQGYKKNDKHYPITKICRYFESFDDFIRYRKGDLRNCDLSGILECDKDFSVYIVNETTKLPISTYTNITYSVKKYYDNKKFHVTQKWLNDSGLVLKEYQHEFFYFFNFVAFLKEDLSNADLLFCDGLANLVYWDFIDFTGAKLKSTLCEKFGLPYNSYRIDWDSIKSFEEIKKNEVESTLILQHSGDLLTEYAGHDISKFDLYADKKHRRVHYITDIHLPQKIENAGCRSKEDVEYVVQKIVDSIASETDRLLLIGGDVSSDIGIFHLFIELLYESLGQKALIVFVLGNHELWGYKGFSIDEIVAQYRSFLEMYGMYLLHNDILYIEDNGSLYNSKIETHLIKYDDMCRMKDTQLFDCLRRARCVILGCLGFAGYNIDFNADSGIYQGTLDREHEIKQTKIFESLYNRLSPILAKKNTIVLTHTPKGDWCRNDALDKNFIYVNGHTHRNFFYDDGEYRIYSDNQVGYNNKHPHLKAFLIDNDYDYFLDYNDGIFEITRAQYNDFYHGRNISMTFNREVNIIYMLKKKGYFCFIHKSKKGSLAILNGGAMKNLEFKDVQYYYDNMESMISSIKTPLDKFTLFQKQIADNVKRIGGYGNIHGCIIDIDFYNHIYVNPIDFSTIGYWASDIVNKVVYPSIPALLKEKCPAMFNKYSAMLEENSENMLAVKNKPDIAILPQIYLDTDIYKASREIKKMQRLDSNILTSWYEDVKGKRTHTEFTENIIG